MQRAMTKLIDLNWLWTSEVGGFCVGRIIEITEDGRALVDYPGNPMGSVEARTVITTSFLRDQNVEALPVLLVFENGDPALPIILGIIRDSLYAPALPEEITLPIEDRLRDVILDGKKVALEAKEKIVLRCGKSSVTLRKDGKILVKGTQIVSRASGTNKIKGAAVRIN